MNITRLATCLLLSSISLPAAIVHVDAAASGSNTGEDWKNAYPNLQDALAAATSGDEIRVAGGSYYPDEGGRVGNNDRDASFHLKSKISIVGGFTANFSRPNERDLVNSPSILSGDIDQDGTPAENSYHVVRANEVSVTTRLDGFTIISGNADTAGSLRDSGGGLLCYDQAAPQIISCTFSNNAGNLGGAVYLGSSSSPAFTDCTFTKNQTNGNGGAILNDNSSPSMVGCTFIRNSGTYGGAIRNEPGTSSILTNCRFEGNTATVAGGALSNGSSSKPVVTNCSFQGNHAANNGGAIRDADSDPLYTNCTLQGNAAGISGGAIYGHFANITFANSLIWENSAGSSSSSASASFDRTGTGGSFSWSHSLVENHDLTGSGIQNLDGTDLSNAPHFILPTPPFLAPLAGGDLRIAPGSPTLDLGKNSNNLEPLDLAGNSRIENTTIDLGAYEAGSDTFLHVTIYGDDADDGTSWDTAFKTLQRALSSASPGDIVLLAEGSYYPDEGPGTSNGDRASTFALPSGVILLGGYQTNGDPGFMSRDPIRRRTVLSGDLDQDDDPGIDYSAENARNILTAIGDGQAAIDGFIIKGGNGNNGGGLICLDTFAPFVSNCTFEDNNSASGGGAIYNSSQSPPTYIECTFKNNKAISLAGGAMWNYLYPVIVKKCSFQGNTASVNGGAVYNSGSVGSNFINCLFQNNSSRNGGAVRNAASSSIFTNCVFQGNFATQSGGAILNTSSSPILTNCVFEGNASSFAGGAIDNISSSTPTLSNCLIWNNAANGSTSSQSASLSGTIPVTSHCLIENWTTTQLAGSSNYDGTLPANDPQFFLETDPLLAPIPQGGDLRLFPGSPAIDSGDNTANHLPLDLIGNPRIHGGNIDLGAYESSYDKIFHVNALSGDDANNGASWPTAFQTLQMALAHAKSKDLILISAGTYYPDEGPGAINGERTSTFVLPSNLIILGGYPDTGNPDILTRDHLTQPTILSGDLDQNPTNFENAYHVVTCDATTNTLLDGLVISGGNANTTSHNSGGGISAGNFSSLTLINCSFEDNSVYEREFDDSSSSHGGAISAGSSTLMIANCSFQNNQSDARASGNTSAYAYGGAISSRSSSTLILTDCTFVNNSTDPFADFSNSRGGAIYASSSSLTVTNCAFEDNSSTSFGGTFPDGEGGAIYFTQSKATFTNCHFDDNSSDNQGGAMWSRSSTVTLANCILENNRISGLDWSSQGGAMYSFSSTVTSLDCIFRDNSSGAENGFGGAISNNSSYETYLNCAFLGNYARSLGGAFYNSASSTSVHTNCSFQGNRSSRQGGAFYNSGSANLTNCSLQGNRAEFSGGAFYNSGSANLTNSIIWYNRANSSSSSQSASLGGDLPTCHFCLIGNWTPAELGGNGNLDGTSSSNDPLFVQEIFPGSSAVGNLKLRPDSPALNVGDNSANSEALDLAGNPRRIFQTIDLGAYEADLHTNLWNTDHDKDQNSYAVEQALGSDPDVSNPSLFRTPGYDENEDLKIVLPKNPWAADGTHWILKRTSDLVTYTEIWRYDGTSHSNGSNITADLSNGTFTIIDRNPPTPNAFYRFEAEYLP